MSDALKPAHEIERFTVDSSTIKSVGYDAGTMVVEFNNGNLYAYAVTPDVFEQFATSPSKGKHFNEQIKGKVSGTKLTGKCSQCGSAPEVMAIPCPECGGDVRAIDKQHKEAK